MRLLVRFWTWFTEPSWGFRVGCGLPFLSEWDGRK
jgi:hypothetical protein